MTTTFALVVTSGPLAGERFEIERELLVGRIEGDVKIDDPEVSRRHAAVRPASWGLEIEDLGSLNGTWVDGERIAAPVTVTGGETVRFGEVTLVVEAPTPAASGPAETVAGRQDPAREPPSATAISSAPASAPEPAPALPHVELEPARSAPESPPRAPQPFTVTPAAPARGGIASRRWAPTLLSFAAIALTAVALVIYFAMR